MRRFHLIELHEQPWYPALWREIFQLSMGRAMSQMGALDHVADDFRLFLETVRPRAVLDMCSGSGELPVSLWKSITASFDPAVRPTLMISDLYPNREAFRAFKEQNPGVVDFYPSPVNVLSPPADAPRVRTMFNSLHHFRPEEVLAILRNVTETADGFAAFEVTRRTWRNLAEAALLVPLLSAFFTAFKLEPVRFRNVLWGLLLPVVPITTALDGLVSNLRTYTVDELTELTQRLDRPDFRWKIGIADIPKSRLKATYVFGWKTGQRVA